ncbi:glycosyltransferase family 4 protein [[Clostridium] symbiosum]|jgi:glycosyltransferase involved in cell wall biosynthesis|uniref:glycosyltransferase family 4 protein n=1 Tax=Clostridium symbiosum TaxID=1512 RepID=UPI00232D6620|nr:glycosyltransferase family 4 protein [[Clostridium] symbiosum]MDB2008589.1 glycosyltransferase family 4 protein [[Clostridium] symbiosum]MDB2025955.1 glycosyltransferase family 4 protein [[Clostridium] symbiosum]
MNILINYPKRGEGGPAFSLELAKGFQDCGHQVYAVIVEEMINADQWKQELPEDHVVLLRSHKPGSKISFFLTTMHFLLIDYYRLRKKFRNIGIDVSIRTLYSHLGPVVDKAIKPKRTTAVCHDPKAHSGANRKEELYYNFYHNVDDVFVLTRSFIKETAHLYKLPLNRVHFVPHGRMNMYKTNDDLNSLQDAYTKRYHFLFFGRIEDYKGLHILAKAYKLVTEQYPDCELTILGNGNFDSYRQEYAQLSNIHLINRFIEDDEIGNYFALNNTIAVVPYTDATQSGVIPIAFEFGTPVIASDVGGLKEQLNDGQLGLLYENNDPEQLKECMIVAIGSPNFMKEQKPLMLQHRETIEWSKVATRFWSELGL